MNVFKIKEPAKEPQIGSYKQVNRLVKPTNQPVQDPAPAADPPGDEELLPADCGSKWSVIASLVVKYPPEAQSLFKF